jgi:hypothetical protein
MIESKKWIESIQSFLRSICMKKITKYLICAAIVTLPAMAQEKPAEPGYHTHDGFYLNLMGGIGAAGFSETVGNASLTISGLA